MLQVFPTLLIPALIYALMAMASWATMPELMASPLMSIPMPSSAVWTVSVGQLLILLATVMLFIEILKSTRPSKAQMVDNALSVGVFIFCFVLFLLVRPFGTFEFFLITMMALLDFLAAAVIMTRVAQRTVAY